MLSQQASSDARAARRRPAAPATPCTSTRHPLIVSLHFLPPNIGLRCATKALQRGCREVACGRVQVASPAAQNKRVSVDGAVPQIDLGVHTGRFPAAAAGGARGAGVARRRPWRGLPPRARRPRVGAALRAAWCDAATQGARSAMAGKTEFPARETQDSEEGEGGERRRRREKEKKERKERKRRERICNFASRRTAIITFGHLLLLGYLLRTSAGF